MHICISDFDKLSYFILQKSGILSQDEERKQYYFLNVFVLFFCPDQGLNYIDRNVGSSLKYLVVILLLPCSNKFLHTYVCYTIQVIKR